jgi:hypothetical protein
MQITDDAYLHADLTRLRTKVSEAGEAANAQKMKTLFSLDLLQKKERS